MSTSPPFDLVIGLDRSDRKADLHMVLTASGAASSFTIKTSPEAVHDWLASLRQQHPHARVAICFEQPAPNLLFIFETFNWITLYPLNPISLQKFREAFVTSRAKDDGKDAYFLAELLLTHWNKLKPWLPDDSQTRRLQQLASHRRAVIDQRTELTNRLQSLLKQYFPQALELCGEELWRPLATRFLLKWTTLQSVQKAKPETLRAFYHAHGSRSEKLIQNRLLLLSKAVALTDEEAVLQSHSLRVRLLCRQLEDLHSTVADFDALIQEVFDHHPDCDIFKSLPGAGPVLAPRLAATMGSRRERYQEAANLQSLSGIAPVTKQSGKSRSIHRRYRCPVFMKQTFHEFAGQSIYHCAWAAAYYQHQRGKGCSHHTALRALAFKWQRIIWKCWQTRTPYDDALYNQSLIKRGSSLATQLTSAQTSSSQPETELQK